MRLGGVLAPDPCPRLAPSGGDRVLVVAPHPDDEAAGCAGTLLAHRAAGDEVRVVVATDGRRSRAGGLGPAGMAERRRREADQAARRIDASLVWLGLPESAWSEEELTARLRSELRRFEPHVVYAPSRVDYHPEHLAVAAALGQVVEGAAARVRIYQVHVPLGRSLVNLVADASAHADGVLALLTAHASQWGSLERTLRLRRYAAARHGLDGMAEEFREVSTGRYAEIHRPVPSEARPPFRGLRHRPFTDPLAWWVGRAARRALLSHRSGGS